ncbi:hypothetical protein [Mycolicibacterium fluoranthenivorans]|uniref:DUF3987 domain-containing protein n=1 Tax=Mycolicibacterium fluoranthenivorans TaxID=258505 RepID=A0A1G4WKP8_9MYCO|nr:hypothetical protein [Mycolicibacterium fluoranthenivorans]SCX24765.1 hypothetical protein SAMN02799620_03773 [Mycolicibacterium fluoranthenivorans]
MNDGEFWSATDQLKLIYQWARASYVAPWALLVAILTRVIATTGPHVMLPGPPAPASLNMGVVLVGRSGSGKGVTDKVSRVVWPADIHEEGLGSGQGIAELFKEQKNPEDRITRALVSVSEIDHMAALNAGQGNNTRATLKAALTGDRLGSKGASSATTRAVPADSYRLCLSISAQFGHCGVLLDDVSGGTPQRPVWIQVTDPEMPEEPGPTPDQVLDTALPPWALSGGQVLIQYGPPEIREYIRAGLLANGRGDGDAIDGHRTLTRLKVAAALAILDHRSVISALDWHLSEVIMSRSDTTRDAVMEYDRQAARAKVRERAIGRAVFDEFIDDRHTKTVRSRILRLLSSGPMSRSDLRRAMGKQHYREAFDALLPQLEKVSQVIVIPGEKAPHYALNMEFTGEPEFTPENTRSVGVNHEFTGEPSATVTDLDSRRSHEVPQLNADVAPPKLTARQWFDYHIAGLIADGQTTAESLAVYAAGEAAGHPIDALRSAASRNPDVRVITRSPRGSTWDITGTKSQYMPATEWVNSYIGRIPAGSTSVDRDDFRAAAEQAGYSWTAVRHAALNHKRVASAPAEGDSTVKRIWILKPDNEGDEVSA